MHLKHRHLATFHAVMEEGSISKAADRMGLSQPAVSVALTRLEEMVGYSLFHRSKGYFVPRPEAEQLHVDAELAILAFERFSSNAKLIGRGSKGLIRIGSIGSAAINFLPDMISDFYQVHKEVEIDLQVRSSAQIAHFVGNGQMDIGIIEAPVAAQSVNISIISLPCVCIMREDDPLAELQTVTPRELEGRRLISVSDNHVLDRKLRDAFVHAGVVCKVEVRSYFFAIMRNLVARGTGLAIVDVLNGCANIQDGVVWRKFEPELNYKLAIITRKDSSLQPAAVEFLSLIQESLMKHAERPLG